jgi:glycosyltransferase involved in cell wall biosynthesis
MEIVGGQSIQAARLIERLRGEASLEVDFIPLNPGLPGPLRLLQRIKYVRTVFTFVWYCLLLALKAWKYDVLHIFSASYWSFLLGPAPALVAARLYGKGALLNYHSGEAADHLAHWRTAIPILRLADRIVVPSGYLVDVFRQFGVRAEAIYNFVDMGRFRYRERVPLHPVFLANRNFQAHYNVACTLRAFARIQRVHADAALVVAGDGPQRDYLESLARELDLRNVRFTGQVSNDAMVSLYAGCDIYLNSPNIDNMPLSIIETYACGLPVVTTNAGGIPYIVTDHETGLLVPCDDDAAMAEGALWLLANPERAAALARNGHALCRQFTWEAVRDQWVQAYRQLALRE